MRTTIKASEAQRGRSATTVSKFGGIGLCRLVDGRPWISGGNGFYYEAKADTRIVRDGGEGYREAIRFLSNPQ